MHRAIAASLAPRTVPESQDARRASKSSSESRPGTVCSRRAGPFSDTASSGTHSMPFHLRKRMYDLRSLPWRARIDAPSAVAAAVW